jgi:hypothetical protein
MVSVAQCSTLRENGGECFGLNGEAGMDSYRIAIEQRAKYLYVTVTGDNTVETIARYMAEIRAACVRLRMPKVLVVGNLIGPGVSMLDLYKVVAAASDDSAGFGLRAAYVELNPVRSDANMQMAENVALTRGIPVRTFRDIEKAEAWLLEEPSSPRP